MAELQTFVLLYDNAGTVQLASAFTPRSYQTGLEALFRVDVGETELVIADKDTYAPINKARALAGEPLPHYRVVVPAEYTGANLVKRHAPGVILMFKNEMCASTDPEYKKDECTYKHTFEDRPAYLVSTKPAADMYVAAHNEARHAEISNKCQ